MSKLTCPVLRENEYIAFTYETEFGAGACAITRYGLLRNVFFFDSEFLAEEYLEQQTIFFDKIEDLHYEATLPEWREIITRKFAGDYSSEVDIPLDSRNWTDFQKKVYDVVKAIPPGKVRSYGEVAEQIGKPDAARAIGRVMAQNPAAPIIPCHRVIGKDGQLVGYSATGGILLKRKLLAQEGVQ